MKKLCVWLLALLLAALPCAALADAPEVGDIVTLGCYEQDGDASNGPEPIEWRVLDANGETATLISQCGLDAKPYNDAYTAVTWETCTLRQWLNGDFLNAAFTPEEQDRLQTVTVAADANPEYKTNPGKDTQDRVFLLSIDEAIGYFALDADRACAPTKTAVENGAYVSKTGACWQWLRSPGQSIYFAARVSFDGSVHFLGSNVDRGSEAVRPVVVVRFE